VALTSSEGQRQLHRPYIYTCETVYKENESYEFEGWVRKLSWTTLGYYLSTFVGELRKNMDNLSHKTGVLRNRKQEYSPLNREV
jgi:hypothetical protein